MHMHSDLYFVGGENVATVNANGSLLGGYIDAWTADWEVISHDVDATFEKVREERINMPQVDRAYEYPDIYESVSGFFCALCFNKYGSPECDKCWKCAIGNIVIAGVAHLLG